MTKGKNGIYVKYVKRILDVICALLTIVCFFWLYIAIAILVRKRLGSPVIFKQARPGKDGKIFNLYKFRTMLDKYDENGKLLPDEERLTEFGRWLRGTSLDEIPEVFNILKGDMSVIGPRPQLVRDMVFMTPEQKKRHDIKPGLSGLAQVRGRNCLRWDKKLKTDIEYIEKVSFVYDCLIVFSTVNQVFCRRLIGKDDLNEVDLTDDYGVFLLKRGEITKERFEEGLLEAEELIRDEGAKRLERI